MDLPIPPAPLPDGKGVVSACASVLHTCCLTPFSYRQPLPIGKGPPAGRGIGRRVRWQSLGTYETDYDLRRQKTARSFVVSLICTLWLPAHGSLYPPCPPSRWEGGRHFTDLHFPHILLLGDTSLDQIRQIPTNISKLRIDLPIIQPHHHQSIRLQVSCSIPIIQLLFLRCIMLRTINFNHKSRIRAIKVHNKRRNYILPFERVSTVI